MTNETRRPSGPQISIAEEARAATEDAVDHFCWSMAQVIKRLLGLRSQPQGDDKDE